MNDALLTFKQITQQVTTFLQEDIGSGDVTAALIPGSTLATAEIITRQSMVLCGRPWADEVFKQLDEAVSIEWRADEGESVSEGSILASLSGPAVALLTGERTALNILQSLSATASVAKQYAQAVAGTSCKVLDTRKTIPGLRAMQKYAVRCGGCYNHRMGLYDAILIKENHIIAAGSIADAVINAKRNSSVSVEVEVENLNEFRAASQAKPDRIMLDNFSLEDMKTAVLENDYDLELEASGNIELATIREVASTGVDFISTGALTKHLSAIDLSMRIQLETGV